eukprot:767958-Hanusia_phi.AAC.11
MQQLKSSASAISRELSGGRVLNHLAVELVCIPGTMPAARACVFMPLQTEGTETATSCGGTPQRTCEVTGNWWRQQGCWILCSTAKVGCFTAVSRSDMMMQI